MSELKFQTELKVSVRQVGGFCEKMSNRFKIGVPDLLIQLPGMPSIMVECKHAKWPKRPDTPMTVDLTPLQRKWLKDYRASGGKCGWALFTTVGRNPQCLIGAQLDPEPGPMTQVEYMKRAWDRGKGKEWPIVFMMNKLVQDQNALR